MSESPAFSYNREYTGGGTAITLEGVIDEKTSFAEIFSDLRGDTVSIDLGGVKRINSIGIREWTNAVRNIPEKFDLEYLRCSRFVVNQLNMILNFLTRGSIVSFYAPYYCTKCGAEHEILFEVDELAGGTSTPDPPPRPNATAPAAASGSSSTKTPRNISFS